ncbi:hypothetical protein LUQ84_003344 [Hamiltosporidium tvaerminnensis]|nr:hypothetical protein LUQ84_003344 [Hamiltosporidium tvaerminnensis]
MKNQQKKEERRENNSRKTKECKETLKETAREINSVATNYGDTRNSGESRNSVATNYGDTRNSGETNFVATNSKEINSKTTTDILTNTTSLSTDDTTTNDETRKMYKQAFEMLTSIISNNNLHSLFDKTLSKLNLILEIQIYIFKKNIPNIYKHMSYNKIEPSLYIYGWYLTLFTRFPIQLVLRIWDIFLFYGFPILLVSASSILKEHEILILESQEEQLIEVVNKIEGLSFNVERVIKNLKVFIKQLDMSEIRRKLG